MQEHSNTNVITNSIVLTDLIRSSFDSNNTYITSGSLDNNYNIPILASYNTVTKATEQILTNYIGVTVTGVPTSNPVEVGTTEGIWNYNAVKNNEIHRRSLHNYTASAGLTEWSTQRPIKVGWVFDGLPTYGPHGYEDPSNTLQCCCPRSI